MLSLEKSSRLNKASEAYLAKNSSNFITQSTEKYAKCLWHDKVSPTASGCIPSQPVQGNAVTLLSHITDLIKTLIRLQPESSPVPMQTDSETVSLSYSTPFSPHLASISWTCPCQHPSSPHTLHAHTYKKLNNIINKQLLLQVLQF